MGLYEYMLLNDSDQWNELWQSGTFLTHHIDHTNKYTLYALHDFFVEVKLDAKTSKILNKRHFKTGHLLDKYSGNINL